MRLQVFSQRSISRRTPGQPSDDYDDDGSDTISLKLLTSMTQDELSGCADGCMRLL